MTDANNLEVAQLNHIRSSYKMIINLSLIYAFSDELPVQLQLPRPLREAKSRQQLSSLTLLGQEFWGYPMANSKNYPNSVGNGVVPMAVTPSDTGSSLSSFNTSKYYKITKLFFQECNNYVLVY